MNFEEAIKAHSDWKSRLYRYAKGQSSESFDIESVGKDNICELGTWLYGEGSVIAKQTDFQDLINVHAEFHRAAASIIALIDCGDRDYAEKLLKAPSSRFNQLSVQVIHLLRKLKTNGSEESIP